MNNDTNINVFDINPMTYLILENINYIVVKKILLRLFLCLILVMGCEPKSTKNNFNPELAMQLGPDDYGMKKYTIALLKKVRTGTYQKKKAPDYNALIWIIL